MNGLSHIAISVERFQKFALDHTKRMNEKYGVAHVCEDNDKPACNFIIDVIETLAD